MANVSPGKFVLRCYGKRQKNGRWYGLCLDFNIAVEADSSHELKNKLNDAILSYIDVTIDTKDSDSIPSLMSRRAPLQDWVEYYLLKLIISLKEFTDKVIFNLFVPFSLSPNNC